MTKKIPVGQTISAAYNFAFTRFFSVLGVVWFPYLVFAAIVAGLVFLAVPDLPRMFATHEFDIGELTGLSRVVPLIGIIGFIASCMIAVGVQRTALGRETGPRWFYFSLGPAVWRMAAAFFLAGLVVVFIACVIAGICAAIWFAAANLSAGVWAIRVIAILAGICFIVYIVTRLLFFLPAVVIAEETIGIERAWILSRGNFWRIFLVWLAIVVPVLIASWMVSHALLRPFMFWPRAHMDMRELVRMLVMQFGAFAPIFLVIQFVERLVLLGVGNGAIASAYRAVAGSAAPTPAPGVQAGSP
ncbi:MAG TPA: hypothetical protein VGI20_03485 [Rhizomicrobium sp.]|jgi:hypothetical protein